MNVPTNPAPELMVSHWLRTDSAITLARLRGRVVVVHAFQMLCPACISHGLPQAAKIKDTFAQTDVAVIGLHTVFEHHAVMGVEALKAFIHEYRINFPVGVDQASAGNGIPLTMQAYNLRGTPSLVLIDRMGNLRLQHFGHLDDMQVGALIGQLVTEGRTQTMATRKADAQANSVADGCDVSGCATGDSKGLA
jgi:AhpC/TSA family